MEQPQAQNKRGGRGRGGEHRGGRGGRGGAGRGQSDNAAAADVHSDPPQAHDEPARRGGRGRGEGRGRGNSSHDDEGKGRGISKAQELFPVDYAEIEKISNEINSAFRRIDEAHEKEEKLREAKRPLFDERNRIRATLQEGFDRNGGAFDSKKERDAKVKALSEDIANKGRLLREVRDKLPFKDDKDPDFEKKVLKVYDDKVKELEKQMENQNLSGPEERRVLSKVKDIKKERNTLLPQYKQLKESQLKDIAHKEHLIAQNAEAREKLNSIRENEANLKSQIAEISAKIDGIQDQLEKSKGHREEEKKKIDELRKEKDAKHDALYEKVNHHFERQRIERERQRKAREERAIAAEQKRKEWEERKRQEEAARVPFEEEISVCDCVLHYLEAQIKIAKPAAAQKKGQGRQRQRGERALCHPPDMIESFEYLSLVLPLFQSDLEGAVAQVKAKKESFLGLQRVELEKRANPHASSSEHELEESPVVGASVISSEAEAFEGSEEKGKEEDVVEKVVVAEKSEVDVPVDVVEEKVAEVLEEKVEEVVMEKAAAVIEEKAVEVFEKKDVEVVVEEKAVEVVEEKVEVVIEEKVAEVVEEKVAEVVEEKAVEVVEENVEVVIEEKAAEVVEEKAAEVLVEEKVDVSSSVEEKASHAAESSSSSAPCSAEHSVHSASHLFQPSEDLLSSIRASNVPIFYKALSAK